MSAFDDSAIDVSVARVAEHEAMNALYVRWGYHGGIAETDRVYVARIDGAPVGIVRRTREFGLLMLRGMQVAPTHQRRGIGTRLLRAFAAELPDEECFCIPYEHLVEFYGQIGFARFPEHDAREFLRERLRRYREEGRRMLVMRRAADAIERG